MTLRKALIGALSAADYAPFDKLASHKVKTGIIAEHWDDLLRLARAIP
jgi:hypothetical protein